MKPGMPDTWSGSASNKLKYMIASKARSPWVGLVCDATSATLFVARGVGVDATLVEQRHVEYAPAELNASRRLRPLEQLVAENRLRGCGAFVAFAGSGTIVQRLTLPPLSRRDQLQAVQTHLMNYADGDVLAIDVARDPQQSRRESVRLVAAGVDRALSRAICTACRRAGLRVRAMTALASALGPATDRGALVQLILCERATTIQLFDDGHLIACRDILLGRRDFVQAYQRPILTDRGPITLSAQEADALSREIGIPTEQEHDVRPDLPAARLWPMLDPVLQKLLHEVEQSVSHSDWQNGADASLSMLGLVALPGLDEFLAAELHLRGGVASPKCTEASYLAAFSGGGRVGAPLDLRPPEQRWGTRMTKPALAAGLCALLIVLTNSVAPQRANVELTELRPVAEQLQDQLAKARARRADMQTATEQLAAQLQRTGRLVRALPTTIPAVGPLKVVFRSVPPNAELFEVRLSDGAEAGTLNIRAGYHGREAASLLAARWARELSQSAFFADAKVTSVSGSGYDDPAIVEIRAELQGG